MNIKQVSFSTPEEVTEFLNEKAEKYNLKNIFLQIVPKDDVFIIFYSSYIDE